MISPYPFSEMSQTKQRNLPLSVFTDPDLVWSSWNGHRIDRHHPERGTSGAP